MMTEVPRVAWVADETTYRRSVDCCASSVPVIIPQNPARALRWASVLDWYSQATTESPIVARSNDVVVALGGEHALPARAYAERLSRQFAQVDAVQDLVALRDGGASSLMIWAHSARLDTPTVDRLGRALMGLPWGVVTAPDLAGITFMAAKMMLAGSQQPGRPWTMVGEDGAFVMLGATGITEVAADPQQLHSLIARSDTPGLSMVAHGDGGHLDVSGVVVCGSLHNCAACRSRARAGAAPAVSLLDIRTQYCLIATCHGFALDRKVYAPGASIILAAVEGHVANLLTTYGRAVFTAAEPMTLMTLLHEGAGAGAVQCVANDLHLHHEGRHPWLVVGDPAGALAPRITVGIHGDFVVPAGHRAFELELPEPIPEIVSLAGPPGTLLRGAHSAVLTLSGRALVSAAAGSLEDRTAAWHEHADTATELELFVRRANRVLHSMSSLSHPQHQEAVRRSIAQLITIRTELEVAIHQLGHRLELATRSGSWDPQIPQFHAVVEDCIALWDKTFGEAIAGRLIGEAGASLLATGYRLAQRRPSRVCQRCGSLTACSDFVPESGDARVIVVDCPVCGLDEAWEVGGPRLRLGVPPMVEAGMPLEVLVQLEAWTPETPGQLVVQLRDNMRREVVNTWNAAPLAGVTQIVFPMDQVSATGLCTIDAAWVRGLRVTYRRAVRRCGSLGISDGRD